MHIHFYEVLESECVLPESALIAVVLLLVGLLTFVSSGRVSLTQRTQGWRIFSRVCSGDAA